jgi:hypothetical protein
MSDKGIKKAIIIGASVGALVSLGVALSMDMFLSGSLQGTWWDAATKDVTKMFGPSCGQNAFVVGLVLFLVMAFLAGPPRRGRRPYAEQVFQGGVKVIGPVREPYPRGQRAHILL